MRISIIISEIKFKTITWMKMLGTKMLLAKWFQKSETMQSFCNTSGFLTWEKNMNNFTWTYGTTFILVRRYPSTQHTKMEVLFKKNKTLDAQYINKKSILVHHKFLKSNGCKSIIGIFWFMRLHFNVFFMNTNNIIPWKKWIRDPC